MTSGGDDGKREVCALDEECDEERNEVGIVDGGERLVGCFGKTPEQGEDVFRQGKDDLRGEGGAGRLCGCGAWQLGRGDECLNGGGDLGESR